MAALPQLLINGRLYVSDTRLKEFRAVDNPHERISWDTVDDNPDAYQFGPKLPAPTIVTYTRTEAGMLISTHGAAQDGRPFFKDLPVLVRAASLLHYAVTYDQHRPKLKAAQTLAEYQAVKEDILYKCAIDAVLDPAIPQHQPFITDVSVYADDYATRNLDPLRFRNRADALYTESTDIAFGRAIFEIANPYPKPPTVHVVQGRSRMRFADYPWMARAVARFGLFWSEDPHECGLLAAARALPLADRRAVWDDLLCARADRYLKRTPSLDLIGTRPAHFKVPRAHTTHDPAADAMPDDVPTSPRRGPKR